MDSLSRLALLQRALAWTTESQPTGAIERMAWIVKGQSILSELGALKVAPPAPESTEAKLVSEQTYEQKLDFVRPFMADAQYQIVQGSDEFVDIIDALFNTISTMPKTYETDGMEDPKASLHYFSASSDWWITEKDMDGGIKQAFGLACLNGDWQNAELGYISIEELVNSGHVELDFHYEPESLSSIKKNEGLQANGIERPVQMVEGIVRTPLSPDQKDLMFQFRDSVTKGTRQKENIAAAELLDKYMGNHPSLSNDGQEKTVLSADDQIILSKYSGNGGGLTDTSGKKGSDYEYYTPKPIAQAIWDLLGEYGVNGGTSLDPSSGTGIFGATAPANMMMDSVELDYTSGNINKLLHESATHSVTVSNFETVAANTPDDAYDVVATNVPFSSQVNARGNNWRDDPQYQNETLDAYFLLRSIDKIRAGGLGAFIVPTRYLDGKENSNISLRIRTQLKAEFLGAWRLPNKVFNNAGTDVATDIIVFRKYSKDARNTIRQLYESNDLATLYESRVLDESIIGGHYFRDEGRRFIIGEFQAKDKNKMRDVDHYITDESVANIAKLIRKFPDSRVNLDLIGEVIVDTPQYNEGDLVVRSGQAFQLTDGEWKPLASREPDPDMDSMRIQFNTARNAYYGGLDYDAILNYTNRERPDNLPVWLATIMRDMRNTTKDKATKLIPLLTLAYAVQEGVEQYGLQNGYDFTTGSYGDVSYGMIASIKAYKAAIKSKDLGADNKAVLSRGLVVFNPEYNGAPDQNPYSLAWRGENTSVDSAAIIEGLNDRNKYERLRYVTKDPRGVPVEQMKEIDPNFNAATNDDFCLSHDGQFVLHADDYYIGNVATLQNAISAAIAATDDPVLKSKLTRQLAGTQDRYTPIDISRMSFDLLSRYVKLEMKLRYLKQYVWSGLQLNYEGDTPTIDVPKPIKLDRVTDWRWRQEYIARMTARYVWTGGQLRVTIQNATIEEKNALLAEIDASVKKADAQFSAWVKSQPDFIAELQRQATSPENLNFDITDDTEPLVIDGFAPAGKTLNGYQNSEIRRMARRFSGITGFDVGLGKTLTALGSVQHMLNLGLSMKTAFVVPNGVLPNWRNEAFDAYGGDLSDCLFVGLNYNESKGKYEVNSADYARDIAIILNNAHKKIFMTYEAWQGIPMMQSTLDDYEEYVGMVDGAFSAEEMTRAKSERKAAKLSRMTAGAAEGGSQFFEMLGIDKAVVDELQAFKNAKTPDSFKGAKYLSMPPEAQRALDMSVKLWFIRDGNVNDDGVMGLTATPITNSPLEIYSMLSLAEGEAAVNRGMLGIKGADAFLETFAEVEYQPYDGIDGSDMIGRVFTGIKNLDILKNVLHTIANIRTAAEEKLPIPDANVSPMAVPIDDTTKFMLELLKETRTQEGTLVLLPDGIEQQAAALGLTRQLNQLMSGNSFTIRNPLTLCNEMANLSVEGKNSLLRVSRYAFDQTQLKQAQTVVDQFNKKSVKCDTSTRTNAIRSADIVKDQIDVETGTRKITYIARARIDGDNIELSTNDYTAQKTLTDFADKAGLNLNPELSAKVLCMLDNFRAEQAKPLHKGHAKQLIFVDNLSMHIRLKVSLIKQCGVPASKIAIINGVAIKNPIQMQDISDGFNADQSDNVYEVVIANKKAEVGLNLQKGTQAIHHLTIGWTPDSIHQRNGRGVRQGNVLEYVTIYYYDQQGTFDEYKRNLVNKKASWIDSVMTRGKGADNRVSIAGGLDAADYDLLIAATGDAAAVTALEDARRQRDIESRQRAVEERGNILRAFMDKTIISLRKTVAQKATDIHIDFFTQAFQLSDRINIESQKVKVGDKDSIKQARREAQLRQLQGEYAQMSDYIAPDLVGSKYADLTALLQDAESVVYGRTRFNRDYKSTKGVANSKMAASQYESLIADKPDNAMSDAVKTQIESEQKIVENSVVEFMLLHPELTKEQAQKVATGNAILSKRGVYAEAGYIGVIEGGEKVVFDNSEYCVFFDGTKSGLQVARPYTSSRGVFTANADSEDDRNNDRSLINTLTDAYAPDSIDFNTALDRMASNDLEKISDYKSDLLSAFQNQKILSGYFPELESRFKEASDNVSELFACNQYAPNDVDFSYLYMFVNSIPYEGYNRFSATEISADDIGAKYGLDSVIYRVVMDYAVKGYKPAVAQRGLYFTAISKQINRISLPANKYSAFLLYALTIKEQITFKDVQSLGLASIPSVFDAFSDKVNYTIDPTPLNASSKDDAVQWMLTQFSRACPFIVSDFFLAPDLSTIGSQQDIDNILATQLRKFPEISSAYQTWLSEQITKSQQESEDATSNLVQNGLIGVRCNDPKKGFGYFITLKGKTKGAGFNAAQRMSDAPPVDGKALYELTIPIEVWQEYMSESPEKAASMTIIAPFASQLTAR